MQTHAWNHKVWSKVLLVWQNLSEKIIILFQILIMWYFNRFWCWPILNIDVQNDKKALTPDQSYMHIMYYSVILYSISIFDFQVVLFQHGCKVGLYGGDIKKLLDDLVVLRPTLFVTVPRLLNRIYDKVGLQCRDWLYLSQGTWLL